MAKSIIDEVVDDQDDSHDAGRKGRDDAKRRKVEAKRNRKLGKKRAKERKKEKKKRRKHELKMAKKLGKRKGKAKHKGKAKPKGKRRPGQKKKEVKRGKQRPHYPAPGEDRGLDVAATAFISNIYTKLEKHRPGYSPLGMVLEDKKWSTELQKDGFGTTGTVDAGFFKQPLVVDAEYISAERLHEGGLLMDHANAARSKKQYLAKCFIVATIDKELIPGLKAFRHPNFSPYFYDLKRKKLLYNRKDKKTAVFAEWFKDEGRPKTVEELIHEVEDKNGMFTKAAVGQKLNLETEALDELFDILIDQQLIVDVDKKNYTFV